MVNIYMEHLRKGSKACIDKVIEHAKRILQIAWTKEINIS